MPVHVLQVGNNVVRALGGMPQAMADVRRALGGTIVSLTDPALRPGEDAVLHLPQARSALGRRYGWGTPAAKAPAVREFQRCDLVMVHGLYRHHFSWACRLARAHAKPYVVVPHGALDPYVFSYRGTSKALWWRWVGRPATRAAAGVLFATQRERAKAAPLLPPVNSHVVHLPVELPPMAERASWRAQARARLGIAADRRVVLFLGRFDPLKRLPLILDAFQRAGAPGLHLVVAGPDTAELGRADCERRLDAQARTRVHFTGPVAGPQRDALFAAADAFVNVSTRENFGYALAEALAAGLPAILGHGNDLGPELAGVDCTWPLPRDDVDALARAFGEVSRAPVTTLRAMGDRGRSWVAAHLGFERFRASLQRLCAGLLA